jgi:predicted DNA-binding antitoxin AbrB/MazE fold protein
MAESNPKTLKIKARARKLQADKGLSPLIAEACAGIDEFLEASKAGESLDGLCTIRTRSTLEAVYEQGVLRLDRPIDLAEGSRVEIIVLPAEPGELVDKKQFDPRRAAKLVAEIAALPLESSPDGFSGEDHDEVLYGGKKPR